MPPAFNVSTISRPGWRKLLKFYSLISSEKCGWFPTFMVSLDRLREKAPLLLHPWLTALMHLRKSLNDAGGSVLWPMPPRFELPQASASSFCSSGLGDSAMGVT